MARKRNQSLDKPTREYLLPLRAELEEHFRSQDAEIDDMRAVRELRKPVPLHDDFRFVSVEVRDATATDEIQRVAASLSLNPPKLTVTPQPGRGDKPQENATLREGWTSEVLQIAGGRGPGQHTLARIIDSVVADGGGWCKFLHDKDVWDLRYSLKTRDFQRKADEETDEEAGGEKPDDGDARAEDGATGRRRKTEKPTKSGNTYTDFAAYNAATEEAKRAAGPPFMWKHVDARCVYPVFAGGVLAEVLEVQERPQWFTFRKYRLTRDGDGNIVPQELGEGGAPSTAKSSTVQFVEHWDDEWCTYLVLGKNNRSEATAQVVQQWKHGYGRVPYFHALGLAMGHWGGRKVGWSIAQPKKFLVEYKGYLRTLNAQLAARDVLGVLFREVPREGAQITGKTGKPVRTQKYKLGEIVNGEPGEKLSVVAFNQVAQALRDELALTSEDIDKLSTPRVRSEIGAGLEGAGFAINQVLSEARIRFDPLSSSIEAMLKEITDFLWWLVCHRIKEKVYVLSEGSGEHLVAGPEDLTDSVTFKWRLEPERPTDNLIRERYWHERLERRTAHWAQAVEAMGDNPDEILAGLAEDDMRADPAYKNWIRKRTFERAGRADLLLDAEADKLAATGMFPDAAPAMGGDSPVPDMGALAASPNGAGMQLPAGPVPGAPAGMGMSVPGQSAAAGVQRLMG